MIALAGALVLIAVAFPLLRKIGDVFPWFAALGTAAAAIFLGPKVPHSPIACLAKAGGAGCTQAATDWVMWLVFVLPLAVAVLIKMIRGDRRGRKGNPRR